MSFTQRLLTSQRRKCKYKNSWWDFCCCSWWSNWGRVCPLAINNDKTGQNTWNKDFQVFHNSQGRTVVPKRRLWVLQSLYFCVEALQDCGFRGVTPYRVQSSCWVEETDIRAWGVWDGQNSEGRIIREERALQRKFSRNLPGGSWKVLLQCKGTPHKVGLKHLRSVRWKVPTAHTGLGGIQFQPARLESSPWINGTFSPEVKNNRNSVAKPCLE